jgi:hypothetical protein
VDRPLAEIGRINRSETPAWHFCSSVAKRSFGLTYVKDDGPKSYLVFSQQCRIDIASISFSPGIVIFTPMIVGLVSSAYGFDSASPLR